MKYQASVPASGGRSQSALVAVDLEALSAVTGGQELSGAEAELAQARPPRARSSPGSPQNTPFRRWMRRRCGPSFNRGPCRPIPGRPGNWDDLKQELPYPTDGPEPSEIV